MIGFFDCTGPVAEVNVSSTPDGKAIRRYSSKWLASGLTYPDWCESIGDMLARNYTEVIVANPLGVECDRGMDICAVLQLIDAGKLPEPHTIRDAHIKLAKRFKRFWFYTGMVEPRQWSMFKQLGGAAQRYAFDSTMLMAIVSLYRIPGAELIIDCYADRMKDRNQTEASTFNGLGTLKWGVEPVPRVEDYRKLIPVPRIFVLDHDREKFYRGPEYVQPQDATEYLVAVTLGTRDQINERAKILGDEPGVTPCVLAVE